MLATLAKTFDFSGTATRGVFWGYAGFLIVLNVIGMLIGPEGLDARTRAFIAAGVGLITLPVFALTARRLHETNRSGWWALLLVVPVLVLIPLALCARKAAEPVRDWPARPRHRLAQGALLVFVILLLGRLFYAPYWAPSGAMKPGLLPGDYMIVRLGGADAEPGDIVVFRDPDRREYFFRIVVDGGDAVAMENGVPVINGTPVPQTADGVFVEPRATPGALRGVPLCKDPDPTVPCEKDRYVETLPNGAEYRVLDARAGSLDEMAEKTVPADHVFVLGDNRDNALDSRASQAAGGRGMVARDAIIGRVTLVLFSSSDALANVTAWRPDRFFVVPE